MITEKIRLMDAKPGEVIAGFRLEKKEYIPGKKAELYTLRHEKTRAQLLYFDRADENKTFAVSFQTLPENDTGVFHILEHSVLNGSKKYPVKEPFVSLLQSSMQTFLNAFTFGDKTMYPVSSRSEQDLFNLMSVYLDAVFCPAIYEKPEIFMQEGWHYEFDEETGEVTYNGVVFSEMKGAYANVERLMGDTCSRLLFPDTCYGFSSGGRPESIPDLTYEQFVATHQRFYHPSNARFFLDGHMDIHRMLEYIDGEYLSKYDYRAPDFGFREQQPVTGSATVYFEPSPQEEGLAHMTLGKVLCRFDEAEKLYAATILADYLAGSNEAPLKRAFLEKGLGQDISLDINDGVYQPSLSLTVLNTDPARFEEIRSFVAQTAAAMAQKGLNPETLHACMERFAFSCREIHQPHGVELAMDALESWLYGGDPMMHIENGKIFDALRSKLGTGYFESLLMEMLGNPEDKCYVYALPSKTKLAEDAQREKQRIAAETAQWDEDRRKQEQLAVEKMQQWQQSQDGEEALMTLPVLNLRDIPRDVKPVAWSTCLLGGREALKAELDTDGIVYLELHFDVSDFDLQELRELDVMTACLGKLRTKTLSATELQNRIKATLGHLSARLDFISPKDQRETCTPYLTVSAAVLRENIPAAAPLLLELMRNTCWEEKEKIREFVLQGDYYGKQALIGNGQSFAIDKVLSGFSAEGAFREAIKGESSLRWIADLARHFEERGEALCRRLSCLADRAFAANRLFLCMGGETATAALEELVQALPERPMGAPAPMPQRQEKDCALEIPADVGFSALGGSLQAMGSAFSGAWSVLSSLMTFSYLWGAVRVQGGAYGTGMSVRANGDVFCYSYRDPNLQASRQAFAALPQVLAEMLQEDMPLDDIIIGTVNTTEPLLEPASLCQVCWRRYVKKMTDQDILKQRHEILDTTAQDLRALLPALQAFAEQGLFCAVGGQDGISFVNQE